MFKFHSQNSAFVAKNLIPQNQIIKKNLPKPYRTKNLIPHKPYPYPKPCLTHIEPKKPHPGPIFFQSPCLSHIGSG